MQKTAQRRLDDGYGRLYIGRMPQDLAPLLRKLAIFAVLIIGVPFALMMKGSGFKNDSPLVVLLIAGLLLAGAFASFAFLDSSKARNAKLPNPMHPANRPSEPPPS